MPDPNVLSFAAHKAKRAPRVSTSSYSLHVDHYADCKAAEFRVAGRGESIVDMGITQVSHELAEAIMCISHDYDDSGGTDPRPVAIVLFYSDGRLSSTGDLPFFASKQKREWLTSQLAFLPGNFAGLFKKAKIDAD